MGQYFKYMDEYETYWVKFMALFNNRRKRESRSLTQLYNILSIEIGLNASILASFYRHQKSPRRTSIDKIIEWVKRREIRNQLVFLVVAVVIIVAVAVVLEEASVEVIL
jgi:hypothetical protein